MSPAETKTRILAEWSLWSGHGEAVASQTKMDGTDFFALEQDHIELLAFETTGDKLDAVTNWLTDAGLIK